jgi:hypothetical protein
MSSPLLPISIAASSSGGGGDDAYSLACWENVRRAVGALGHIDYENVPALRRALRSLDRALWKWVEQQQDDHDTTLHYDKNNNVSDVLSSILARPYSPDEPAQQLLASILTLSLPYVVLAPEQLQGILSLLLSLSTVSKELQLAWLRLLVHENSDSTWNLLLAMVCSENQQQQQQQLPQWLERLYLLLQRVHQETTMHSNWTSLEEYTIMLQSTDYQMCQLYKSCIQAVVTLIHNLWQQSRQSASSTILTFLQESLDATWQQHTTSSSRQQQLQQVYRSQCLVLLEQTRDYSLQLVDHALDALDGAILAVEDEDADQHVYEYALQDVTQYMTLIVNTLPIVGGEWNLLDTAPLLQTIWKQCARAFVGMESDRMARISLQLMVLFLSSNQATAAADNSNHLRLDTPTLILTLFRAVECCPSVLLEEPCNVVWDYLAAQLQEQPSKNRNHQLQSSIQLILISLQNQMTNKDQMDDFYETRLDLGTKFLRLVEDIHNVKPSSTKKDWDDYFCRRFTTS